MVIKNPIQIDDVLESIRQAVSEGNWDTATSLLESLRRSDQADVFSDLPPEQQQEILPLLGPESSADILEDLEDEDVAEIASRMGTDRLVEIVDNMEPDEAADLLGDISEEQAEQVLSQINDPEEVRYLLVHPDETAGGVMTALDVTIIQDMTVDEAIWHLRHLSPDSEDIYYLFVQDKKGRLVGVVSLRQLVIAKPGTLIRHIMDKNPISIDVTADQEEAARLMQRYDLLALPVVDANHNLVGMITYDDLLDVLEDEATEDIYRLGGIPKEQPADVRLGSAMKTRLPWLILNLLTALISSAVLSIFEGTIAQVAVIAAFFPIVAGVSGSAATQTLTVTVRGLALGDIEPREGLKTLGRELLLGLVNGVSIGVIVALIALVWKGTPLLGFVVGISTLLNMICAGIAGVLVPMLMHRLKFDPALASPILVTTMTDTLGYFFYLGLATMLIAFLV
ncbi:magnesium transporter [bacterium]|nr:magnesium transporter [bacterium]